MKLLRGLHDFPELVAGSAVTIGNFDGMHCGHQALLSELIVQAKRLELPTLVVFFEPQPSEYFDQDSAPARIMSRREKLQRLASLGIDYAYCFAFNQHLAALSADEFAHRFIFELFKAKVLLIGQDFCFGRGRSGTPELLAQWGHECACPVVVCPDFVLHEVRVSSTLIRQALSQGRMEQAAHWLGQPFTLSGRVIYGDGRGREWGVPTANIEFGVRRLPLHGVFCVQVQRADSSLYWGVANVGKRPTFNGHAVRLEVHLLAFAGSLYHERLTVRFVHRLRDEKKFASLAELIEQIDTDLNLAKNYIHHIECKA
jgi:riboflavin kinase/FMN adenylyltransferase